MCSLGGENGLQASGIDLVELIKKMWVRKKLFIKIAVMAIILGIVIVFSIPKEYTVIVTLAPESTRSSSSNFANAAAMLGLGNVMANNDRDALNVNLFPEIISSNPFALDLYNMSVKPTNSENYLPLNEYVESMRKPWWTVLGELPRKIVGTLFSILSSNDNEESLNKALNPFHMTQMEAAKLAMIKNAMLANIDKKTGIATIMVTLQDAEVAAIVADSVVIKLQNYVTDYRTKKAALDCEYWEKLYIEKQKEYYEAQQKYANYVDENKSLFTQKSKIEGVRLQNEMNLAFQIYNQIATQLQLSQGKLQEAKPVFAVIDPATIPLRPSAPRKVMIIMGCLFLAFVGTAGWVLFGEDIWKKLKNNAIN